MARVPNYIYRGDNLGIGQGISNLGQALFGDPQAAQQMEHLAAQDEYTRALQSEHEYTVASARKKEAQNAAITARLLDAIGYGNGGTPMQGGASPDIQTAAGGEAPSLLPPPGAPAPVAPVSQMPLPPMGAPAMQHGRNAAPGIMGAGAAPPMPPAPAPVAQAPYGQHGMNAAPGVTGSDDLATSLFASDPEAFQAKLIQRESGGRNVGNSQSSAFGPGQITQPTWTDLGLPGRPQDATPEQYQAALTQLEQRNAAALTKDRGFAPSDSDIYTAHHFGVRGAENILGADPNTPIDQVISPKAFAANQNELVDKTTGLPKTVGQLTAEYSAYFKGNSPIQPIAAPASADPAASLVSAVAGGDDPMAMQTAAGGEAPAPVAPVAPGGAGFPMSEAPGPMGSETTASAPAPAPAVGTPPAAAPGKPAPTGDPFKDFINDLSPDEKQLLWLTAQQGGDVVDTLTAITQARIKAGPQVAGSYGGTGLPAQQLNVLNEGNQIMKAGGTMDPSLAQQYISAWMTLTKSHSVQDQDGQMVVVPGVNLKGYGYLPPPGVDPAVLESPDMPDKPRSAAEQTLGAAVTSAKQSLDAAMQQVMPDGKINFTTTLGMYQPDSSVGQALMSWIAPEGQAAASQFQNAVNQAYTAISGKAVTESEAARLAKAFMPTPGMNPAVAAQRILNLKSVIDAMYESARTRGRNLSDDSERDLYLTKLESLNRDAELKLGAAGGGGSVNKLQMRDDGELE